MASMHIKLVGTQLIFTCILELELKSVIKLCTSSGRLQVHLGQLQANTNSQVFWETTRMHQQWFPGSTGNVLGTRLVGIKPKSILGNM